MKLFSTVAIAISCAALVGCSSEVDSPNLTKVNTQHVTVQSTHCPTVHAQHNNSGDCSSFQWPDGDGYCDIVTCNGQSCNDGTSHYIFCYGYPGGDTCSSRWSDDDDCLPENM